MNKMIPVNEPLLNGNEKRYLMECIDTGWISSEGPFVKQFEEKMANYVGREHGIAVCNGTVALELAIAALGLKPGDEVIIPTFTIISCALAVIKAGCTPVLVDADPVTWNINVEQIESKITSRTKAIMMVHIYGLPCDVNEILRIAKKHDLKVIEDAAEVHGQTYNGIKCGGFGDISIFSFYPNKHVTTGEGGMLLTNDESLAYRCRSMRNLCFKPEKRYVHDEIGFNFRMTNLQAAVGVAQLEQLDKFVKMKRKMGEKYTELLYNLSVLQLPLEKTSFARNIYWVYGIVLKDNTQFDAKNIMNKLRQYKVATRPFFWPMHEQPVFQRMGLFKGESYPVAENIARRGFYIPSGLALTEQQIKFVATAINEILLEEKDE